MTRYMHLEDRAILKLNKDFPERVTNTTYHSSDLLEDLMIFSILNLPCSQLQAASISHHQHEAKTQLDCGEIITTNCKPRRPKCPMTCTFRWRLHARDGGALFLPDCDLIAAGRPKLAMIFPFLPTCKPYFVHNSFTVVATASESGHSHQSRDNGASRENPIVKDTICWCFHPGRHHRTVPSRLFVFLSRILINPPLPIGHHQAPVLAGCACSDSSLRRLSPVFWYTRFTLSLEHENIQADGDLMCLYFGRVCRTLTTLE